MTSNFRDGYMEVGEPLGMINQDVSLVADDQVLILNPKTSLVRITSDNTTATNRTFTFPGGYRMGQQLMLTVVSAGATTCQLVDGGNVALSAAWTPQLNDTLSLVWNGSVWLEQCRSDN